MSEHGNPTRVGVIMAGGSGERFWPLSRQHRPKQMLRLTRSDKTMLEEAVERLTPVAPVERVYVQTGEHLLDPIRNGGVGIPDENVIAEPMKRNTSGALAYAAAKMLAEYGGDGSNLTMAVTTADHLIGDESAFAAAVETAAAAAEQENALVTLGVVPTRPETGYGYIQVVEEEEISVETGASGVQVRRVKAFREKPNREMAEEFLAKGNYFWNSGMFFWRIADFLRELEAARPPLAKAVRDMAEAMAAEDESRVNAVFESLEDISIDYALMEQAKNVLMVRAEFAWDDVGAWTALDRTFEGDEQGNVLVGEPVALECEDCIVYNETGAGTAVSVIGMEDVVVVVTSDGVLVMPKSRAQDVKKAVQELKDRGADQV